ncbi:MULTISPECIES: glycosyltransferase family 39 protein [Rhodopseudomonas]|uniref:Glycosyl transferase n=1 Tax=Rhodopseudomonas palustris TaxID=1076 RepID=A0A0D7F5K6_RHOPL|nr:MULTISPECIES: glycosyltransferase family 39 protein [Rhodopseudomonas]KIZ46992.1 glycosyl transferase [Rhodopseudomonas palustris]MDF3809832.1 glycosyltransferase family 39 protein [Rhodopseudomonas sp. BAL398]WOK20130.1 glycosyltransferase family 39 protein [Rhodopseudomonas sp. BAL398]
MDITQRRLVRATILIVAMLVALRLAAAALTPLSFDEAYYWTWSKHLAASYYDHPPMVAWVIRLGTMIAGDTAFGVRLVSVLLALPMSWATWRAAELLFGDRRVAASAAILLNATMMAAAGTAIVTPDAPLLVASSFVLYALAQVVATGRGLWWLGVGTAVGAALLSKYTALFFGPAILIWLVAVPDLRCWLRSPWPYLGGLIALGMFAPVILWNADHQWMSFTKQFGRARVDGFHPGFIAELFPTQFMLATPLVFILGTMGLYALLRRDTGTAAARGLINATVWTIFGYFVWHATHSRVEGNWLSPIYPAFAVAAAVAATMVQWPPQQQRLVDFCRRWAVPGSAALFVLIILQVNTGLLTGYKRDASVRAIGVGVPRMVGEIEAVRQRVGASCVVADDYGTTSWLAFYLPKGTCVAQRNERYRWTNTPEPDPARLAGKLLLVGVDNAATQPEVAPHFARIDKVGVVTRQRGPLVVDRVELDTLEGATGAVLDRSPPAR